MALTSMFLALNPVTMVPYGAYLFLTGVDPFTGHHLSDLERGLAIAPVIGKMISAFARAGAVLSDASRLGKAGALDDLARSRASLGNGSAFGEAAVVDDFARGISADVRTAERVASNRPGRKVAQEDGLEWALRSPMQRANRVVEKYGINLRASGQRISLHFDPAMPVTRSGRVFKDSPTVIHFGPDALRSEEELAGTIAHELRHARAYLGSGSNLEPAAEAAEEALARYILGKR